MEIEWAHKDEWKHQTRHFTVTVTRHSVVVPDFTYHDGGNRWCVYAYIYPSHWMFHRFDESESMSQDACRTLPLHGGASLCVYHQKADKVTSIQVGADYNHLGDDSHTHDSMKEDARSVFMDAERLIEFLRSPIETDTEGRKDE